MADDLDLRDGFCRGCNAEVTVTMCEYSHESPEHYDGISEYECNECHRREGRWSGKVLKRGEEEKRWGGQP